MLENSKTMIIVGGSLAGLMNAIVSRRLGFKVHILERREPDALESEAAGIRAGPEVHQFLERYVQDYDYNYAITADSVEIMDANGNIVERLPPTAPLRLTTWKTLYDLLKREALKDDGITASVTYKTYHLVLDVDYSDDKPLITVQDLITNTIKTMEADLVVAADGAHSIIRKKLSTDRPPAYAGYVSWRGRVPEANLSLATREALQNRCVILRVDGGYQISYYVPADRNTSGSQQRDFVWIWYDTLSEASPQFTETFTDIDGKRHSTTIPKGKISSAVWQRLLERKASVSNSHFVELMENIAEPFVTAIRDRKGSKAAFYDGRLFLTGDALALCRPHSGSSTSQAAFQAQELLKVMKGEITPQEWEETCFREAAKAAKYSLAMAQFFCTGKITSDTRKVAEVEASR